MRFRPSGPVGVVCAFLLAALFISACSDAMLGGAPDLPPPVQGTVASMGGPPGSDGTAQATTPAPSNSVSGLTEASPPAAGQDTSGAAPPALSSGSTTPSDQAPRAMDSATGSVAPSTCDPTTVSAVPFRVMTRLNRVEYDNTVRDLLGDNSHTVLNTLPPDAGDGAFDNNAGALTINPSLVEAYLGLATTLAIDAMAAGSPGRSKVLVCDPASVGEDACALQIATDLGTRAFRRALEPGEADGLLAVYTAVREQGLTFDDGVTGIVEAVLLSPKFLFRPEVNESSTASGERPASGYELANRLSYFLWSSMPDATLLDAAGGGELDADSGIAEQVTRMLGDTKAEALYSRFPGLWLHVQNIAADRPPAPEIYPAWSAELGRDMEAETAAFMHEFMTTDVNFLGFLDSNFTYLNKRLADFYGISGNFGDELARTELTTEQRGGILTHGSVLRVTSPSERTSPVIRGAWVLARILNAPPPPPPDNLDIPKLEEADGSAATPSTTRAKLEAHRANPTCASCHNLIDPLGFGLEHFDGIGAWRDAENGVAVDASSTLQTGETLDGAKQLEALLKADSRTSRGIAAYMLSYSLGRVPTADDKCRIDALNSTFASSDYHMKDLVQQVAINDAFKTRTMAP